MGNLETATGYYDRAMEYFNRAIEIRNDQGDTAANQLGLLYLCVGRVYSLRKDYKQAQKMFNIAEALFVRTLGAEKHYMAHLHCAYGKIEYREADWLAAKRSYSEALRIATSETPIHPITAAAYYSLGCVEFKLKHMETAKAHLDKAKVIAELRSPTRDDGTKCRIMWMLSRVMAEDVMTAAAAEELRIRAEIARVALVMSGECAEMDDVDEDGNLNTEDEILLYDAVVPIFFR